MSNFTRIYSCHNRGEQSPKFCRECPNLIMRLSTSELWKSNWDWNRHFSHNFGFILSIVIPNVQSRGETKSNSTETQFRHHRQNTNNNNTQGRTTFSLKMSLICGISRRFKKITVFNVITCIPVDDEMLSKMFNICYLIKLCAE